MCFEEDSFVYIRTNPISLAPVFSDPRFRRQLTELSGIPSCTRPRTPELSVLDGENVQLAHPKSLRGTLRSFPRIVRQVCASRCCIVPPIIAPRTTKEVAQIFEPIFSNNFEDAADSCQRWRTLLGSSLAIRRGK